MSGQMQRWKDAQGHVLGLVKHEGHGLTRLLLFRDAIDGDDTEAGEVMAIVEGYVADVRCSKCGAMRTWVPGEAALRRLLLSQRNLQKIVSEIRGG